MARVRVSTDVRGCRTVLLDRADKRNALDEPFLSELLDVAASAASDNTVRLVLLRSTSSIFCAGADLNEWANVDPRNAQRLSALGSRAFQALADLPVPVVAALEGAALGGGLELALACDIRVGSHECSVGFPEPRLGNSPAWGGMARLIAAVGPAFARDMLLTGDTLGAADALRIGVVQRLYDLSEFPSKLEQLIDSIVSCDPGTLTYIKMLLGAPSQAIAAQEAAIAGFTATRAESRDRKKKFLASRRSKG
jgi:enoyl-CoA hydratase/carnithine racemase